MDTTHTGPPFLTRASVHFPILTRRTPGPTPPSAQVIGGSYPGKKKTGPCVELLIAIQILEIRLYGDMPSLPLTYYGMMVLKQAQE